MCMKMFLLLKLKLNMLGEHIQPYMVVCSLPCFHLHCLPSPCTILLILSSLCPPVCSFVWAYLSFSTVNREFVTMGTSCRFAPPFAPDTFFSHSSVCSLCASLLLLQCIKLSFLMQMEGLEKHELTKGCGHIQVCIEFTLGGG